MGQVVNLDVDLPEIDDLPTKTMSVPARGWQVKFDILSDRRQRELYARHVHGICFRILGEAFAALPGVAAVTVSGYSQRPDAGTGQVRDEYLLSVAAKRSEWSQLNFAQIRNIDVIESLSRFNLVRKMTKTWMFSAIEPL